MARLSSVMPFLFGALTFVCTFGSALLGTAARAKLPAAHLGKESQDVIRLGMGLVATMTALLLGLVTASAKGAFDAQDVAIRNAASGVLTLDRLLARYGPETRTIREQLRTTIATRVEEIWPVSGRPIPIDGASAMPPPAEIIENAILELAPQTDQQRWLKAESLKLTEEVLRTRFRLLGSRSGALPRAFMIVVIFWLSMTFASFGLGAPRNGTVVTVFAIAALSVGAAIFLILELDTAFEGLIRISGEPFRYSLSHLGS